jgi:hypothetical protein
MTKGHSHVVCKYNGICDEQRKLLLYLYRSVIIEHVVIVNLLRLRTIQSHGRQGGVIVCSLRLSNKGMASIKLDQSRYQPEFRHRHHSSAPEPKFSAMRPPVFTLSWAPLGKAQKVPGKSGATAGATAEWIITYGKSYTQL